MVSDGSVAAVDLGASSGRVFLAEIVGDRISLLPVARFSNGGVTMGGTFYWDFLRLFGEVANGIAKASDLARRRGSGLRSVGVDSWAVDYGLIGVDGRLLSNPIHHRDARTETSFGSVAGSIGRRSLFQRSGIALHQFNTVFQLVSDGDRLRDEYVDKMLLIPDLISYFLCGEMGWEATNASTTQLVGVDHGWDLELMDLLGIPRRLVGRIHEPGLVLGSMHFSDLDDEINGEGIVISSVASHDTASAVLAVPARSERFAYISSGTWSLVGVELDAPLLSADAFDAGFTNELGAFGRTRFLRNIMGFWLLQEVIREYRQDGVELDPATLTGHANDVANFRFLVDAESPRLLGPGGMRSRLAKASLALGREAPTNPAEFAKCILDSLALAYRRSIRDVVRITGKSVEVIHVVGGGALNGALCQLTADACDLPVVAGPVEAAAIGNAMMQFRAIGGFPGDLKAIRDLVADSFELKEFLPNPRSAAAWDVAEELLRR